MLSELHIENIAVIQKATIPFTEGFNVFTGETGAGKTILISAIDAVLGERTSRDIIRAGEEKAQVTALFENISRETKTILENMGYEIPDDTVLIYREMTTAGKNTCRINGLPSNVGTLKEASKHLIHIHGQRDTQQLISQENHLQMIDDYGELNQDLQKYKKFFREYLSAKKKLSELDMDESQKAQRIDMLEFQINEIEKANLQDVNEEDRLISQKNIAMSSEKIRAGLSEALSSYSGSGEIPGVEEMLDVIATSIENVSGYITELTENSEKLQNMTYELQDIMSGIQEMLIELDFNPAELEQIELRLDIIYNLKKKYGGSITDIIDFYDNAVEEYESISLSDQKKLEMQETVTRLENTLSDLADELSIKRQAVSERFLSEVEDELYFLDMPSVKLSISQNRIDFTPTGNDEIEFMIVTNLGETPKPLGKIASGGEMARIMLAIKNVMADKDNIGTLIFDEIDTGVSGRAAGKIGRKLSEVSHNRQVIGVTHLAQVAAFADNHLYIHKNIEDGRTFTKVDKLDNNQSIRELARITSGDIITEAALESAKELRERAKQPYTD